MSFFGILFHGSVFNSSLTDDQFVECIHSYRKTGNDLKNVMSTNFRMFIEVDIAMSFFSIVNVSMIC